MSKKIVKSENAPAPIGPYSQAVKVGNMLFVSGQIALNPQTGEMENADLVTETKQVMKNIGAILSEAGYEWEEVAKSSIFLKDLNDFGAVNTLYGEYFNINPPARETVQVARLPKDARVEISVIAVKS
jgi:2-iminobutanoate/2-iminopropanoate deaminase